jgi:hypothetical protein
MNVWIPFLSAYEYMTEVKHDRVIEDTTVYKTYVVQDPLSEHFGYDFTIVSKEPSANIGDWFLSDIIGVDMFLAAIRSSGDTKKTTKTPKTRPPYQNVVSITRKRNNSIYSRKTRLKTM